MNCDAVLIDGYLMPKVESVAHFRAPSNERRGHDSEVANVHETTQLEQHAKNCSTVDCGVVAS